MMPTDRFDHERAPLRIGHVRLKVRDLEKVAGFYETMLGLTRLAEAEGRVTLGTATVPLLELAGDPSLKPRDPRDAGLFHTAFLLPSRAELGRWLGFARERGVTLQGASDHIVSEAIYLADPEGNGIEIYADRGPSHWHDALGAIHMTTKPMDAQGVLAAAEVSSWAGFPEGGFIGHAHLQVGDTDAAERFYHGILGFDVSSRYRGASFFASGGYHHHLAGNIWNSRGAGVRPQDAAGLDEVGVIARAAGLRDAILARAQAAGLEVATNGPAPVLADPWGTRIALIV